MKGFQLQRINIFTGEELHLLNKIEKEIGMIERMVKILEEKTILSLSEKERKEIYNALCCLNVSIRDKQKRRAKFISKMIAGLRDYLLDNKYAKKS